MKTCYIALDDGRYGWACGRAEIPEKCVLGVHAGSPVSDPEKCLDWLGMADCTGVLGRFDSGEADESDLEALRALAGSLGVRLSVRAPDGAEP